MRSFSFDRPLVLIQSDDWGRVGIRDRAGWEELRTAGINLGEQAYDYYSLETAADVSAIHELLLSHRDSADRPASMVLNFILANVDFEKTNQERNGTINFLPLSQGLPGQWERPGLFRAYEEGIRTGALVPGLHGWSHFCIEAARRESQKVGPRAALLRTLWKAQTPYIYWRMPWIGFEYSVPQRRGGEHFLNADEQNAVIEESRQCFVSLFKASPRTACAPGYRSDENTYRCWFEKGIQVAQCGHSACPPYFDEHGLLRLHRNLEFEPASAGAGFSVETCIEKAEQILERGLPLVISIHAINFHSTLRNFREAIVRHLLTFLSTLEALYPRLLYVSDHELRTIIETGRYLAPGGDIHVKAMQRESQVAKQHISSVA